MNWHDHRPIPRLGDDASIDSQTLQSFLQNPSGNDKTVLLVDEASLISTQQMMELLMMVQEQGFAKLVLIGDSKQLEGASAGAPFRMLQQEGKRGYLKALETEGFNAATEKLESMTGKTHVAAQAGRLIEGTVAQKYELPHGPHAMIETQRAFYLVPWESSHAQKWGNRVKGRVLSGGGIDWDVGRCRRCTLLCH